MSLLPKEFHTKLEDTVRTYHRGNPHELKTGVSEQAIQIALERAGIEHEWHWNDKESGIDFHSVDSKYDLAAKSTALHGVNKVTFDVSGPRTESHDTLEEKINHIKNSHKDAHYIIFGRRSDRGVDYDRKMQKGEGYIDYRLLIIPSSHDAFDPETKDWREEDTRWYAEIGSEDTTPHQVINRSMSSQWWINGLPYSEFEKFEGQRIVVPHKECLSAFDDYDIQSLVKALS